MPASTKGITTENSPQSKPKAFHDTMRLQCFNHVLRTRRGEAAAAITKEAVQRLLIKPHARD